MITADYAIPSDGEAEDSVILEDASSVNITVRLCHAAGQKGRSLVTKKIAGPFCVTIDGNLLETVDGSLIYILSSQYQFVTLQSDSSNWFIIGK